MSTVPARRTRRELGAGLPLCTWSSFQRFVDRFASNRDRVGAIDAEMASGSASAWRQLLVTLHRLGFVDSSNLPLTPLHRYAKSREAVIVTAALEAMLPETVAAIRAAAPVEEVEQTVASWPGATSTKHRALRFVRSALEQEGVDTRQYAHLIATPAAGATEPDADNPLADEARASFMNALNRMLGQQPLPVDDIDGLLRLLRTHGDWLRPAHRRP